MKAPSPVDVLRFRRASPSPRYYMLVKVLERQGFTVLATVTADGTVRIAGWNAADQHRLEGRIWPAPVDILIGPDPTNGAAYAARVKVPHQLHVLGDYLRGEVEKLYDLVRWMDRKGVPHG